MFDPIRPYNNLPLLPPAVELESKAVLKLCVEARTALAELRFAGRLMPDQSVLINAIPILEARDSSEIENIVTTNDALFREASLGEAEAKPATKEALRYRTALYQGFRVLTERPVSTRMAEDLCRTITGIDAGIRRLPGRTLRNSFTGEVIYTPPEGEDRLRGLMANWEHFFHRVDEYDPLVRMAALHYQFEAIHPFPDGNGQTGRILNILMLIQGKLLDLPTLSLSRHILRTRADYYRLLPRVTTDGEWEPWLLYMIEAVRATATWTSLKVAAIRHLMDETMRHVRAGASKIYTRELIELVFAMPYCRIANVVERDIAKRQAASTYLTALVGLGVLAEEKKGRDKIFVHPKYLALLSSDDHVFTPYGRTTS